MAKKTAKKTSSRKAASKVERIAPQGLPKGFEPIAGGGQSWPGKDGKPGDVLHGEIIEFDEFTQGKGKDKRTTQTAKIRTKDGAVFTIYESAGLRAIFEYEEGSEVFIRFLGFGDAKRGQNAPRLYEVGIK